MNLSRSIFPAVKTAEPTLVTVFDPECMGAFGSRLSPSVKRIRFIGSPRASDATWVIDVYVPGPMSIVPL